MVLKKRVPSAPVKPEVKKAVPKRPAPPSPKGVVVNEPKKEEPKKQQPQARPARPAATKPIVPSGSPATESRPSEAPKAAEPVKTAISAGKSDQLTYPELRNLSIEEKIDLHKKLNKGQSEKFVTLIKFTQLPKKHGMRLLEAQERSIVGKKKPAAPKPFEVHYCGYCVDWMPYIHHAWTGYTKCCGCSISTKDFYTSADNNLFNKE